MDINIIETNLEFKSLTPNTSIERIIVHHTASGDMSAEEIHAEHLAQGWSGIGYHYVIRKDGTIERGRPKGMVGAHAEGANWGSIGITLTGNFEEENPKDAQIESLSQLIATLCNIHELAPNEDIVIGHRVVCATACPGENLFNILQDIRGKAVWYQNN
jgi:N-acetylmuramoyl-L-alanine amidase